MECRTDRATLGPHFHPVHWHTGGWGGTRDSVCRGTWQGPGPEEAFDRRPGEAAKGPAQGHLVKALEKLGLRARVSPLPNGQPPSPLKPPAPREAEHPPPAWSQLGSRSLACCSAHRGEFMATPTLRAARKGRALDSARPHCGSQPLLFVGCVPKVTHIAYLAPSPD